MWSSISTQPSPTLPHCRVPEEVTCHRDINDSDKEVRAAAAAHRATLQDEIAIGHLEPSNVFAQPELVSDTELTLSSSAVELGQP